MISEDKLLDLTFDELRRRWPFLDEYLETQGIDYQSNPAQTIRAYLEHRREADEEEDALQEIEGVVRELAQYISQMTDFLGVQQNIVDTLTILPGHDKTGAPETFSRLEIHKGDIISIVGPTGSGKSRLLADIEWVAQKDTPTGRTVLINGSVPDMKWRFSPSDKLVAQLSQNMNFVIDMTVMEFLALHAESRMVENPEDVVKRIIDEANDLSGEQFDPDAPVTRLSGGQSRALMIADTAVLSRSPIVLIDEIENAGIDRKRALNLLLSEEKIVLMATHDPVLALMGERRIVIRNGGIHKVIETTEEERHLLSVLESVGQLEFMYRNHLRYGSTLQMNQELLELKRVLDKLSSGGKGISA